jgi:hypothetical protein
MQEFVLHDCENSYEPSVLQRQIRYLIFNEQLTGYLLIFLKVALKPNSYIKDTN